MKQKLKNAQLITLLSGCALGMFAFVKGGSMPMSPLKENYIVLMGFAELLVIYSLVSIFTTNKSK